MPVEHRNLEFESSVFIGAPVSPIALGILNEFPQQEVRFKLLEMRRKAQAGWWKNTDILDHDAEGKAEQLRVSIFLCTSTERALHRVQFARFILRKLQREEGIQTQN